MLVNPGGHLATPGVFGALREKFNDQMEGLDSWITRDGFVAWLARQRNDLQAPAITLAPQISGALQALGDAELARMSGSGATCFGIYPDRAAAAAAAARIARDNPGWWCVAARTISARPQVVS